MPESTPPGFVLLHAHEHRTPIYLAIDEIGRFTAYDPYRDDGSNLVTSDGARLHVYERTDEIAQLIVEATSFVKVANDA
jgi:hypothetical protein